MWRIGMALSVVLLVVGCASNGTAETSDETGRVVTGIVSAPVDFGTLVDSEVVALGDPCTLRDGYADLGEGASVTIRDGKGEIVAMGDLGKPKLAANPGDTKVHQTYCQAMFIVADVPVGRGFYSIEVSNRGEVEFAEADLFGTPLLTIGL